MEKPMTPQRIKDASELYARLTTWTNSSPSPGETHEFHEYISSTSYIAGATAENDALKPVIEAAEKVAKIFAHNDGNCAICELADALAKWKGEVERPAQPIEYMPVHPEDARKFDCPKQFPMHLLDEGQAMSNHSQSLKRLKERGGLSVHEMIAVANKKPWSYYSKLPWAEALKMLNDIVVNNQQKSK